MAGGKLLSKLKKEGQSRGALWCFNIHYQHLVLLVNPSAWRSMEDIVKHDLYVHNWAKCKQGEDSGPNRAASPLCVLPTAEEHLNRFYNMP